MAELEKNTITEEAVETKKAKKYDDDGLQYDNYWEDNDFDEDSVSRRDILVIVSTVLGVLAGAFAAVMAVRAIVKRRRAE